MAVKIIIKRIVPDNKVDALKPLLLKLRNRAMGQPGYISGETLKRIDRSGENMVISTWQTMDDWRNWVVSPARIELQTEIDDLLGAQTDYEIYTFG